MLTTMSKPNIIKFQGLIFTITAFRALLTAFVLIGAGIIVTRLLTGKAFVHSHTYAGNPLGCAAAHGVLDELMDHGVLKKAQTLAPWLTEQLTQRVGEHPHVGEIRHIGLIHALELVADKKKKTPYDPSRRMGYELYQKALSKGLLLRPLGDVLYFNPPLTISREELTFALDVLEDVLQSLS